MEVDRLDLTLLIVSYHSLEPLKGFFESYRRHPITASHEILVLDNAPGDGTAAWIEANAPEARVIAMKGNLGYARAVNAGIEEARGRNFLIINPDVELSEGGVDRALDYLEGHPEVGIVGARLLNRDGSVQRSARRFYTLLTLLLRRSPLGRLRPEHPELRRHLMLDDDLDHPRPVDWVMGAWMLARREAVERVGAMAGRFFLYFEDVDWCYRMWAGGFEVHYFPDASFVHTYERSSGRLNRTLVYHLRSFLSFYDKWGALVYVAKRKRGALSRFVAFLMDMISLNLAFVAAWLIRQALDPILPLPLYSLEDYLPLLAYTNVVGAVALPLSGRYRQVESPRRLSRWLDAGKVALVATLLVMAGTWLAHTRTFSRIVIALIFPTWTMGLSIASALRKRWLGGGSNSEPECVRVLLMGGAEEVEAMSAQIRRDAVERLVVCGSVVPLEEAGLPLSSKVLGQPAHLPEILEAYRVDELLVVGRRDPDDEESAALRQAAAAGLPVRLAHPWGEALRGAPGCESRYGASWWAVRPPAVVAEGAWSKNLLDGGLGLLLCLLSAPGFVVCSLVGRPLRLVAARSLERVGQRRRKLRWTELVLRRSGRSLPGFVQLPLYLRILAGELSLVGPYPLSGEVEEELGPTHLLRFVAKPGITGLWQTRCHGESLESLVSTDLDYLENWSLTLDLDLFLSSGGRILWERDRWHRPSSTP